MGGHDDFFGPNAAAVCDHGLPLKGPDCRVLADGEVPGDAGGELQRVKLGLPLQLDGAGYLERKGRLAGVFRPNADFLQGTQLPLQLVRAADGIDIGGLFFKVTGKYLAQLPVSFESGVIGLPV